MNEIATTRTFGVLIEFKLPGGGIDRGVEFIDFDPPESAGPDQTLIGIARTRIEAKLLAEMAAAKAGKNWKIISISEC